MAPQADTLDLSAEEFGETAKQKLVACIKRWSLMIAGTAPEANPLAIRLVVDEFMKNVFHGDYAVIRIFPLSDGSFLLVSEDEIGTDHLTDNGSCGNLIINALVGQENYQLMCDGSRYHGFLRLDPHAITAI